MKPYYITTTNPAEFVAALGHFFKCWFWLHDWRPAFMEGGYLHWECHKCGKKCKQKV